MSQSSIMFLTAWIRDWLTPVAHIADLRMAIALALTDEVLISARDLRFTIEPHATRGRGPFMTMWKDHLESEQKRRATYIRSVD